MGQTPICVISANGIQRPSLAACLAYYTTGYAGIYGSDAYLAPDSEDGQLLGLIGAAVDDGNAMAVSVYNSFAPSTAQGAGLDRVIEVNGIKRKIASNSNVPVLVEGVATTTIDNGAFSDPAGNVWLLPPLITIPTPASQIAVTAICQSLGAIPLAEGLTTGQLSGGLTILNPQRGWQKVTTTSAATLGAPIELDPALKARQKISTEIPSATMLDGIVGAVAALPGVIDVKPYQNETAVPDANGAPGYSIYLVIRGGDAMVIAQTIAAQKFACGTWGTTTELIVDQVGVPHPINFFFATQLAIQYGVSVKPGPNYSTKTNELIQKSLARWTNSLGTGTDIQLTRAYNAAYLAPIIADAAAALQAAATAGDQGAITTALAEFNAVNLASTTYEIPEGGLTIARGGALTAADVDMAFNEFASIAVDNLGAIVDPSSVVVTII